MKTSYVKIIVTNCICLTIASVLVTLHAFAAEPPPAKVKRIPLTITYKDADSFYVNERRYIVNNNTVILSYDNKKISFDDLWIPCRADVYYKTVNGNESLCLKLKVKSSLRGDSTNTELTTKGPE